MEISNPKSQRTKNRRSSKNSKQFENRDVVLQNLYAQVPVKQPDRTSLIFNAYSPGYNTTAKMQTYGQAETVRKKSILAKCEKKSTMFLVEEKDSKDTPKFSEIKIGEADYLVFDQTRQSECTQKTYGQSFDSRKHAEQKSKEPQRTQRLVSPVSDNPRNHEHLKKAGQRIIITSHQAKRDLSTGTSRQSTRLHKIQEQREPVRNPSSPNIMSAEHSFFARQDFHPKNQLIQNMQSCDIIDNNSEDEHRASIHHLHAALPAILSLERDQNLNSLKQLKPIDTISLRTSLPMRITQNENYTTNQSDRTDEHNNIMNRAQSRTKILSPLLHKPQLQPIIDNEPAVSNAQIDTPAKLSIVSPPLVKSNVLNIKLRPINKEPVVRSNAGSTIEFSEQKSMTVQPQIQIEQTPIQSNEDKSPYKSILKNPLGQTLTNFENMGFQTINCQSANAEPFIRRAVQRLGWNEVGQSLNSKINLNFHIRFNISDLEGSTIDLKPTQFYNHHPSNREITTKAGLCKNLWQSCFDEHQSQISSFFPRCYDLADNKQCNDFLNDFNQTACLSIVKIVSTQFLKLNSNLESLHDDFKIKLQQFANPIVFKQQFKNKCQQIDNSVRQKISKLTDHLQLRHAYYFAKGYLINLKFQDQSTTKIKKTLTINKQPTDEQLPAILDYHKQLVEKGVPSKLVISTYEQLKIFQVYKELKELLPQFNSIDGTHNMWIIKPSYNARGFGIFCSRDISDILPDKRAQQRIVQKYIEHPLLLNCPQMKNRKFDFRQWVLVLSWEPLDICVFDACYLKICGQEFDLMAYEDTLRHLSNYSLQKGADKSKDLVMSSIEFQEYMTRKTKVEFLWNRDMLPKVNSVVWRSLKSLQETQEIRTNTFEIYGFDIVLDSSLNPWIIEINLSPACAERAEWLTKMLDDSALDLLYYLQNRIIVTMGQDHWATKNKEKFKQAKQQLAEIKGGCYLNTQAFYDEYKIKNRWVRIPESIEEIKVFQQQIQQQMLTQQPDLQLNIMKVDFRQEKRIDRQYRCNESAVYIQSAWRGHLAKSLVSQIRRQNAAIRIQRYVHIFLAKLKLIKLREERAALIITRWSRVCIARAELHYLKVLDKAKRKKKLVVRIQSLYRRNKAIQFCKNLRLNKKIIFLQAVIKGYKARCQVQKFRNFRQKIIQIQKHYKKRFQKKKRAVTMLQKQLRRYQIRRQVMKMLCIFKAFEKANTSAVKCMLKKSFRLMCLNSKAILVQSYLRKYLAKKKLVQLRRLKAQTNIISISRKVKAVRIMSFLKQFKSAYVKNTIYLQSILRGYKAHIRVQNLRAEKLRQELHFQQQKQEQLQHRAVVIVQKYLRGLLAIKLVEKKVREIQAVKLIQAYWKGYIERKKLSAYKIALEVSLTEQVNSQLVTKQVQEKDERKQKQVKDNRKSTIQSDHNSICEMTSKLSRSLQRATKLQNMSANSMLELDRQKDLNRQAIRHAQAILEQMESQKSDIWTKFSQKKETFKKKQLKVGQDRGGKLSESTQQTEVVETPQAVPQQKAILPNTMTLSPITTNGSETQKKNESRDIKKQSKSVVRTTELNLDKEILTHSRRPVIVGIPSIDHKIPQLNKPKTICQPIIIPPATSRQNLEKKDETVRKSYADNLQEILQQQTCLPSTAESAGAKQNSAADSNSALLPMTQYLSSLSQNQTPIQPGSSRPGTSSFSEVAIARESYYKASKVFKGRAEKLLDNLKQSNIERVQVVRNANKPQPRQSQKISFS